MRQYMILATLAAAALFAGCDTGDEKDGDDEGGYVDSGVFIDIPDAAFRERLFEMGVDCNNDGRISTSEAERWKEIDIQGCDDIRTLEGVEYFTGLTALTVRGWYKYDPDTNKGHSYGRLEKVDLTGLEELQTLNLYGNRLTELRLDGCTRLQSLDCGGNYLEQLDLRGLEVLVSLECSENPLRTLQLGKHPLLTSITCFDCRLEQIDLTGCPTLSHLFLMGSLASIDLSQCAQLEVLGLYYLPLEALDLRAQSDLKIVTCDGLGPLTRIEGLDRNKELINVTIHDSPTLAGTLSFEGMSDLEYIVLSVTSLNGVIVRDCAQLSSIHCIQNPLTRFEVSDCPQLDDVICQESKVEQLTLRNVPALTQLYCAANRLTQIDLSGLPALSTLDCAYNQLPALDAGAAPLLTELFCDGNQLESLDLTRSATLERLTCTRNALQMLDISACAHCFYIDCMENEQLTTIRCRNGQILEGYYPDGTRIERE